MNAAARPVPADQTASSGSLSAATRATSALGLAVRISADGLVVVAAGPYSAGFDDPAKTDAPIPGFTGPDGEGKARLATGPTTVINARNFVNPLFFAWADSVASYAPAPGVAGSCTQRRVPAALLRVLTAERSRSTQQPSSDDWLSGSEREMSLAALVGCTPEIKSRLP